MEGGRSPSKEDPPHPVLHSLGGPRGSRDASPPASGPRAKGAVAEALSLVSYGSWARCLESAQITIPTTQGVCENYVMDTSQSVTANFGLRSEFVSFT